MPPLGRIVAARHDNDPTHDDKRQISTAVYATLQALVSSTPTLQRHPHE
jgi:hypothetical protein